MTVAPAPTEHLHFSVTALLKSAACHRGGTTSIHSPHLLLLPPACLSLLLYVPGTAESPLAPPKPPSPPQELQHLQSPSSPFWVLALHFQSLPFLPRPLAHPSLLNTPQHPGMDGPRSTILAPTQLQFGYLHHKPTELKQQLTKNVLFVFRGKSVPHLFAVPHKQVRVCVDPCTVQGDLIICNERHSH